MIIKYTGPKKVKRVEISNVEHTFDPTCEFNEVFDIEMIKWLLHPERKGLFIVEKTSDSTPSKSDPSLTGGEKKKEAEEAPKEEPKKKEPEKKTKPKVDSKKKSTKKKK